MLRPFIAVLALALPAVAQEPSTTAAPAAAKAPFVFEAGTHELRPLVDRCAAYLQRNILIDGKELITGQGQRAPSAAVLSLELQMPVVTDRDGCEEMLQSLLWTQGLTIVALDEAKGVYEILSMSGQRAREIVQRAPVRTAPEVLARPRLRHWVTVAFNLKHINAVIASNSLRPFFSASSNNLQMLTIGSVGNSATLLLSGPQDSVAGALALLQIADVAQGEAASEQQARIEQLSKQVAELAQRLAMVDAQLQQLSPAKKKGADEPPPKDAR